ncbi:unnamed protein product [Phaedon cochleariae]|uniref:DNA/RNA-binding protein Alba-like domain-containing protein n=1 Tax=Phaedon cochleariae TaxID=80249 RepID=A0A9P0DAH5_PHACE|nr:unnamed protein product [Phaedon cochleariae]
MENYRKGKNIEEPLERSNIPIKNLPDNFLWMQVRGGSKIRNLLTHALNEFPEIKHVVWTGFGTSVGKCITCAEIMKQECKNSLHQITRLCYRIVEEYWDPILPELDQLVVKRKLPMIHIYLTDTSLDPEEIGYQAPGVFNSFKSEESGSSTNRRQNRQFGRIPTNKPTSSRNQRNKKIDNSGISEASSSGNNKNGT